MAKATKTATTALTKEQAAALKELSISARTQEEARTKLVKYLDENDLGGMENDELDSLIEVASAFRDTQEEPVDDDDADSGTGDDDDDADLDEDDTEEDDQEEEEPAPKKSAKGKPAPPAKKAPAPAPAKGKTKVSEEDKEELAKEVKEKAVQRKPAAPEKEPAKPKSNRPAPPGRDRLPGRHWEDLSEKEKEKVLEPFLKIMPRSKFRYELLQKSFTVKYLAKALEQNILKCHLIRVLDNGKIECTFVSFRYRDLSEFREMLPAKMKEGRKLRLAEGRSSIHPFSQDEIMHLLQKTDFLKESIARALAVDGKMVANRERLEQALDEGEETKSAPKAAPSKGKPTATSAKKPQVAVIPPDEDDEEEEPVAPPKKKAAPASKSAKKK